MQRRITTRMLGALTALLLLAGCEDVDQAVTDFNRRATQIAGGEVEGGDGGGNLLPPPGGETPGAPAPGGDQPAVTYDLPAQGGTLANAWGQVYGQPAGTPFVIVANEQQVAEYIVQRLQASGWQNAVYGGSTAIGSGQIRVDLALENEEGAFGGGTFTFQPTLDESGRVRLNAQGGDLGGLHMPGNFPAAIGDTVHAALAGAPSTDLARVTLGQLTLEAGVMTVSGTVR